MIWRLWHPAKLCVILRSEGSRILRLQSSNDGILRRIAHQDEGVFRRGGPPAFPDEKFEPASKRCRLIWSYVSFCTPPAGPRIFAMTLYRGLYRVRVNTKFPAQWTRSKVMPLTQ